MKESSIFRDTQRFVGIAWPRGAALSLIESYTYGFRSATQRNLFLVNLLLPVYRVSERRIESPFSLVSRASGRAIRPRNVNVRFPVFSRKTDGIGLGGGRENDSTAPIVSASSRKRIVFFCWRILTILSWFEGFNGCLSEAMWNNGITVAVTFRFFFKFLSN